MSTIAVVEPSSPGPGRLRRMAQHGAYGAAFLAIACWASLALASQALLKQIPPKVVMFWSFVWAAACLGIVAARRGTLMEEIRSTGLIRVTIGLLGTFGSYYCYFQALNLAPVVEANLLNYTWPVQLVAWSVLLLGERFRWQTGVATAMTVSGAFLLIGQGRWPQLSAAHWEGYLFAILSGLFWSAFSVLLRWRRAYAPSLFISCCAAAVASLATTYSDPVLFRLSADAIGLTAYVGVVTVAIGYLAWSHAVQHGSMQVLGALCYLIPVLSTLLLVMAGRNPLSAISIAGAALVVAGAVVADLGRRQNERETG